MTTATLRMFECLETLPVPAPAERQQTCVLLIEDSEDSMLLVKYALEEYGNGHYVMEWASGLSEGIERLGQGGVDIVLLDLGLPESSGAASYTRIIGIAPEVPVVILTGDSREQTEFAVTTYGAEDYLVKEEVSGVLLLQAIRGAIYRHSNRIRMRLS
jgi:DNA-binding response OmpR family regulator